MGFGKKKNCSKNSGVLDKRSENQLVLLLAMKENTDGRVKKVSRKSAFTYKLARIVDALSYYVES